MYPRTSWMLTSRRSRRYRINSKRSFKEIDPGLAAWRRSRNLKS
jgi:hypothetical protein